MTRPIYGWVPEKFAYGALLRTRWPAALVPGSRILQGRIMLDGSVHCPDVVVIHRTFEKLEALELAMHFKNRGAKIVIQEDDDLRALSRLAYHTRGYKVEIPDPPLIAALAVTADRMIVTSEALADTFADYCADVRVIRNYLPERHFAGSAGRDHDPRRTVFAGSLTGHAMDLDWLAPAAAGLTDFTALGDPAVYAKLGLPRGRVEPWVSRARDYYHRLRRYDVGIVPLAPNAFNRAKSWLKALDYAASGLAVAAADTPENRLLAGVVPQIEIAATPVELVEASHYARRIDPAPLVPLLSLEAQSGAWLSAVTAW